jgi:hypothetical protein
MNRKSRVVLANIIFALLIATQLQAQQCTSRTTVGRYLVRCDGYLSLGVGAPQVPAKTLATTTADRNGHFTGAGTVSLAGAIVTQTVNGTAEVNPDCTGTITYAQTINWQPGPPIDIAFVVSEGGDKIDGLVTDPGSTYSCRLSRLSKAER